MITTFNRQELIDMRADAQADYQHAKRIGNTHAMQLAVSEMSAIDTELSTNNNIITKRVELPN